MPLTDLVVRKAMSKDKPFRLADGNGLALLVHPNGSKYWQFEARDWCYAVRKILANGVDPSLARKVTKAAKLESAGNSFEAVALEWFAKQMTVCSRIVATTCRRACGLNTFPATRP